MPADLVVLGGDLDQVPAARLSHVPVWTVIRDGAIVCGVEGEVPPSAEAPVGEHDVA
jgi:hypothetical protein